MPPLLTSVGAADGLEEGGGRGWDGLGGPGRSPACFEPEAADAAVVLVSAVLNFEPPPRAEEATLSLPPGLPIDAEPVPEIPPAFLEAAFPVPSELGRVELMATLTLATAVVLPLAGGASEGSSYTPTEDVGGGSCDRMAWRLWAEFAAEELDGFPASL